MNWKISLLRRKLGLFKPAVIHMHCSGGGGKLCQLSWWAESRYQVKLWINSNAKTSVLRLYLLRCLVKQIFCRYDSSLADVCTALRTRWAQWDLSDPPPFSPQDLTSLLPLQRQELLAQLLELESFPLAKVQAMQSVYNLDKTNNSEVKFRLVGV